MHIIRSIECSVHCQSRPLHKDPNKLFLEFSISLGDTSSRRTRGTTGSHRNGSRWRSSCWCWFQLLPLLLEFRCYLSGSIRGFRRDVVEMRGFLHGSVVFEDHARVDLDNSIGCSAGDHVVVVPLIHLKSSRLLYQQNQKREFNSKKLIVSDNQEKFKKLE